MMKKFLILFVLILLNSNVSSAEESRDEWILREKAKVSDDKVNAASNSSFDKRLPPVMPGEELNDGKGKSKVWSTGGSLPIERAPEVKHHGDHVKGNSEIGIVVDGRAVLPKQNQ